MAHGGKRKGAGRPKGHSQYGESTKPIRLPISLIPNILNYVEHKGYQLPLYSSKVPAGFPSPADEHVEDLLDLNKHFIKHPAATFLVRVSGHSMINAGIQENDILIVDRSIPPIHGKIVVAAIDGQLTVKRLHKNKHHQLLLMPDNPDYPPITITDSNETYIWGVVTTVIHSV
ncbi:MAG TPA: translesion error-prone DNA polymerase V autoproteolytic subunit [Gammaproteobacteria bacterium]|jgi:DNA polymerase V|nr:translesion error-prone DNA polymerase V autoproteolytic subunit [Gammaproteobacteria bacterium]